MKASNVQPMIEPDREQMRRHVAHLFEGFLDGCHEGRIELAWTDGRDGRLPASSRLAAPSRNHQGTRIQVPRR
jgi:hypothetical protein